MTKPIGEQVIPHLTRQERYLRREEIKAIVGGPDTNLDRLYTDAAFLKVVARYFDKTKRILDAGCGKGMFFKLLHQKGFTQTYGADIDDYLTLERPRKEFRVADFNFEPLPWPNNFFSNVAAVEVIEHLENQYQFLREIARVLESGGIFILTTPNPDHIWNKLSFWRKGEFYRFLEGNDHLTLFSDPILKKGALRYFTLVETRYSWGVMPYRWFAKLPFPANKYFGHSVIYVFHKRA